MEGTWERRMSHVCFIERWEERLWQVESKLRTDSRERYVKMWRSESVGKDVRVTRQSL